MSMVMEVGREDDDGRFFEDYTVVGEYEELVMAISTSITDKSEFEFRGVRFKLQECHPKRHPVLDSIDYWSIESFPANYFNLPEDTMMIICILADGEERYALSIATGKLILSALSLVKTEHLCFIAIGEDDDGRDLEWLGWCRSSNKLYSVLHTQHPVALPTDGRCSAQVVLRLSLPQHNAEAKRLSNCSLQGDSMTFPIASISNPVRIYALRSIFPQIPLSSIHNGLDALEAPILLLSVEEEGAVVTIAEIVLHMLHDMNDRLGSRGDTTFSHDPSLWNAKTRIRDIPSVFFPHSDRLLEFIFSPCSEESDSFKLKLFKSLYSLLFEAAHSVNSYDPELRVLPSLAGLWMAVVRELRGRWVDGSRLAGSKGIDERPDWNEPLVFQKLSVVNYCIARKSATLDSCDDISGAMDSLNLGPDVHSESGSEEFLDAVGEDDDHHVGNASIVRAGAGNSIGFAMEKHPDRLIHAPITQPHDNTLITSDLFAHYQKAMGTSDGDAKNARLYALPLSSDMQAFKAANPGSTLLDFCRWHSPKDVIISDDDRCALSERMQEGLWAELWEEAEPLSASNQPPLFDHKRELERAIFYLEDIRVGDLLEQLIAVFPTVFDLDTEHSIIRKRDVLVERTDSNVEELVASEAGRDRLQSFFRQHIGNVRLVEEAFAVPNIGLIIKRRGGRSFLAKIQDNFKKE